MDKKNWWLFGIFGGLLIFAIFFTAVKMFLLRDYWVQGMSRCDPSRERCFLRSCENEESMCPEGVSTFFYKIVQKKAYAVRACPSEENDCSLLRCEPDEKDCFETFCSSDHPEDIPEGERCSEEKQE